MQSTFRDFTRGEGWGQQVLGRNNQVRPRIDEVLVLGPNNEVKWVAKPEYDLQYRRGRGKLMEDLGWEKCFKLGEVLQGCWGNAPYLQEVDSKL